MIKFKEKLNTQQGFTLLEVMVSMVIFLAVIAMTYQLMVFGMKLRDTSNTRVDSMKGLRVALNYVRRDVINAGLSYHNIGGLIPDNYTSTIISAPADADTQQDWLTGIIAGDNVSTNILATNKMDSIGVVTRDLSFNGGSTIAFTGTDPTSNDVIVQTKSGDAANCKPYDLYLFSAGTTQIVGLATSVNTYTDNATKDKITLAYGSADPLGINLSANGSGNAKSILSGSTVLGSFKKIELTTYTVDGTGNLIRTTYGNMTGQPAASQISSRPLISDVVDFQISYLLDDGTVTTDPSLGNNGRTNQVKMNQVVEVEVTLTVNDKTNGASSPITLKEVISTRNLRYSILN